MMMMATGLLMANSLLSLSSASGYELQMMDSFQPTASNIIGYIAIGEEMHFEMDVTIHSIPTSGWGSVFHCGSENIIRMPGIWLHDQSGTDGAGQEGFYTTWRDGDNNDKIQTDHLTVGQTYHLEIDITESLFTVTQDGVVQYSGEKADHTTYDSMVCYASDPWHDAADVTLSNIVVWSGAEPTTTGEPTSDPSVAPTSDPTAEPSMEPTSDPTRDCSVFHIDEFLMDCSVEFDGHDTNIRTLQDDVSSVTKAMGDNAVDIATLQATVAQLVTAATTMADSIDKINDELALVIEALDRMGDWP